MMEARPDFHYETHEEFWKRTHPDPKVRRPVAYMVEGRRTAPGLGYSYVLAGNGLWIEATGPHLAVRLEVAEAEVRGLSSLTQEVRLLHGPIPKALHDLLVDVLLANPREEHYVAILWRDGRYQLTVPDQLAQVASMTYQRPDPAELVLEAHSHPPGVVARFSLVDDRDEQGLGLYGVLGMDEAGWTLALRAGVYGYYGDVDVAEIFDG